MCRLWSTDEVECVVAQGIANICFALIHCHSHGFDFDGAICLVAGNNGRMHI